MRPIWQVRRYYSHGFYGLQLWLTKAQFSQVCLMGNCCTGGWWPRAGADSACLLLSLHGMRFLRGRVEVVDSLATTPYYPNGYFQTCTVWKFHPVSLFNKCVVINSRTCPTRQQRDVGAFSRPFSRVEPKKNPRKWSATLLWWWVNSWGQIALVITLSKQNIPIICTIVELLCVLY